MKDNKHQLRKELQSAGASAAEMDELLPIASSLSLLKGINAETTKHVSSKRWLKVAKPLSYVTAGLAVGMFVIIISQAALPTSVLYRIQKFSDSVAVDIHPQYRANVMMMRAQQVNELVARHADSKQVLATLADYMTEASAYKSTPHANYAAFEYCKTNLEQAANTAQPDIRRAISSSLQAFENT